MNNSEATPRSFDPQYDIAKYDYDLPRERIAQRPAEQRDSARLMVLDHASGAIVHRTFRDIVEYLRAGDVLVVNNTRVLPARTFGERHTTGRVEVLFLREEAPGQWEAMVRCGGNPRPGEFLRLEGGRLSVRLIEKRGGGRWLLSVPRGSGLIKRLSEIGRMPVPPYIKRDPDAPPDPSDAERYQTVYAKHAGAIAAPTAGLHFTPELLERIRAPGVDIAEITLHVGVGTFQPIKVQDVRDHVMHPEFYAIDESAAQRIRDAREGGGRVIAVGTTACRSLEAAAARPEGFGPAEGWTGLYITPPYAFRVVDGLITNFHLPRSSLLLLVSAFAGRERILSAYAEAIREGYRFYSYGDAMLII